MLRPRSLAEVRAEMAGEHRTIMELIARVEAPGSEERLPKLLKSLHDTLVDHFAHEQFPGGLYECMGAGDPRYHDELKVLVREHCEVLSAARALVERSRARRPGDDDGFRDEVARLIGALRAHEHREHRLAQTLEQAAAGG